MSRLTSLLTRGNGCLRKGESHLWAEPLASVLFRGFREGYWWSFTSTGREAIKLPKKLRVVAISGLTALTPSGLSENEGGEWPSNWPFGNWSSNLGSQARTGRRCDCIKVICLEAVFVPTVRLSALHGNPRSLHSCNIQYQQILLWYFATNVEILMQLKPFEASLI